MSTVNTETKVFKQHKSSEDTEHCTELRLLSTPEEPHRYDSSYELCDKADVSIVTATAIWLEICRFVDLVRICVFTAGEAWSVV